MIYKFMIFQESFLHSIAGELRRSAFDSFITNDQVDKFTILP